MIAVTRIVIVGGGPAGYEAALVAAQLGAEVTVVEPDGIGGACVLTDCVPSKTLIATAEVMTARPRRRRARASGRPAGSTATVGASDLAAVNGRVKGLAARAVRRHPRPAGGRGRADRPGAAGSPTSSRGRRAPGRGRRRRRRGDRELDADVVLLATGATPRVLPGAEPDGERILTWRRCTT